MFVGRKQELSELEKKFSSGKKEFGIIYGRRRIGKSTLINEFLQNKNHLFFQAKEDGYYGNLSSFSYEIDKLLGLPSSFVFNSFEEAFDNLLSHFNGERFVLAIDEYPYIVKQYSAFPSLLQQIIDRAKENVVFLISGSDISMLKNEILDHSSPLYKRRTFEMNLQKLSFKESLEYLKNLSDEDKVKYLSLTSTYPYYLSAMNFNISFEENVKNLLFNQYGAFFNLPDQMLSNSTKTQDVYNAILYAVSERKRVNKEIAEFIHEDEAKVSKYISTLLSSEILDKREQYNGNRKNVYYEIGDPLLRFWYKFIFNNQEKIKFNGNIVFESIKEDIKLFIAHGFEDVSLLCMNEMNNEGKLGDVFDSFKNYRIDKSKLKRSIEIDGLSDNGKTLIVVECKYRNSKFSLEMFNHLKESASVFPEKLKRKYYLFSKSGFNDDLLKMKNEDLNLFDLSSIFKM